MDTRSIRQLVGVFALMLAACGRTSSANDCEACGGAEAVSGAGGGGYAAAGAAGSGGLGASGGNEPGGCNVGAVAAPLVRYSVVDLEQTLDAVGEGPTFTRREGDRGGEGALRSVSQDFVFEHVLLTSTRAQAAVVDEGRLELCDAAMAERSACVDGWIRDLASRLYGRVLTEQQVDGYVQQYSGWLQSTAPVDAARLVLRSMMLSPYFVFRIELGASGASTLGAKPPGDAPVGIPSPTLPPGTLLDPFEVAARLSHFVTRSAPDAELLQSAVSGRILTPNELALQFDRLSQTPAGVHGRALHWLERLRIDQRPNPDLTDVGQDYYDLLEQANLFVQDVLQARGGSLLELLTSPRYFLNQRLSEHYGSTVPISADGWQLVELDSALYAGILGHGAVLSRYPKPTERGAHLVMDGLFCQAVPPPPPSIDFANLPYMGTTPRERISSVTDTQPACAACHSMINPPGFALEAFDAQGRLTGSDTRGGLPSQVARQGEPLEVDGPAGLGRAIAESPQAHTCATQRLLEAVLERPVTDVDFPLMQCLLAEQQGASDLDLNLLARRVATSDAMRRTTRVASPIAAVSSALSPIQHAVHEVEQLLPAYPDPAESFLLQQYAELLQQSQELPD